eukprot:841412-Karenia_brevis.AAC.1
MQTLSECSVKQASFTIVTALCAAPGHGANANSLRLECKVSSIHHLSLPCAPRPGAAHMRILSEYSV